MDPAISDYIPVSPVDDEAKKHNQNLPGMGGVYNSFNLQLYHYAGNNPVKYVDPDGRELILSSVRLKKNNTSRNIIVVSDSKAVSNLQKVQLQTRSFKLYQPGAGGNYNLSGTYEDGSKKTWCNQATYDVMESTGWTNFTALYGNKKRYDVGAAEATINLMNAASDPNSGIYEVSGEDAQKLANCGICVVAVLEGENHLSTVAPNNRTKYNPESGPMISQVGKNMGYMRTEKGFGRDKFKDGKVHFYVDSNSILKYSYDNESVCKSF